MEKLSTSSEVYGDAEPKVARKKFNLAQTWESLVRLGLGEPVLHIGAGITALILILLVVWVMNTFYLQGGVAAAQTNVLAAEQTPTPQVSIPVFQMPKTAVMIRGITRRAQIHTVLPNKPRFDMVQYEVQQGDTVFGIAQKYNLMPQTILWGNYETLIDDPHQLRPGQVLNILPTNGVLYKWNAGDGLNGVAKFFGVKPEDIVNFPGNHLSVATVGDFANPNIEVGTYLIVPGGTREFNTWSAPRITRGDPAVAKVFGPGFCGEVSTGVVGTGSAYAWPTTSHVLSGFDYSPETNHHGIDIGGAIGNPIYTIDHGVVVYAGWNNWGYGNVVVIDHGNGWQSLYAHLSQVNVACGASVYKGGVIGLMGSTGNSTGPHLHFELRTDHAYVNPWDYLPK